MMLSCGHIQKSKDPAHAHAHAQYFNFYAATSGRGIYVAANRGKNGRLYENKSTIFIHASLVLSCELQTHNVITERHNNSWAAPIEC